MAQTHNEVTVKDGDRHRVHGEASLRNTYKVDNGASLRDTSKIHNVRDSSKYDEPRLQQQSTGKGQSLEGQESDDNDGLNTPSDLDQSDSTGNFGLFLCKWCSFRCKQKKELIHHRVFHHDIKHNLYTCYKCNFYSQFGSSLLRHLKLYHRIEEDELIHFKPVKYRLKTQSKPFKKDKHTKHGRKDKHDKKDDKHDRNDKHDKHDGNDGNDGNDKHDGHDRHDRNDKHDGHDRHDRNDKHDGHDRNDKHDGHDRNDKHDKHDGHDRNNKCDRNDKHEKYHKYEKYAKHDRKEKHDKHSKYHKHGKNVKPDKKDKHSEYVKSSKVSTSNSETHSSSQSELEERLRSLTAASLRPSSDHVAHLLKPPDYNVNDPEGLTNTRCMKLVPVIGYIKPYMCGECGLKSLHKKDIYSHIEKYHSDVDAAVVYIPDLKEIENKIINKNSTYSVGEGNEKKDKHTDMEEKKSTKTLKHLWSGYNSKHMKSDIEGLKSEHSSKTHGSMTYRSETLSKAPEINDTCNTLPADTKVNEKHNSLPADTSLVVERYWECVICGCRLQSRQEMFQHMLMKHKSKPYRCSKCIVTFSYRWSVHRHVRTIHSGNASCIDLMKYHDSSRAMIDFKKNADDNIIDSSQLDSILVQGNKVPDDDLNAESRGLPKSSVQSRVMPTSSVQSKVMPTSSVQSKVMPTSSVQSRVMPTSSVQSKVMPTSSVQSRVMPTSSVQSKVMPTSSVQSRGLPTSSVQSRVMPTSSVQSKVMPTSSVQSRVMPTSSVQSKVMPKSSVQSRVMPTSSVQSKVMPISSVSSGMKETIETDHTKKKIYYCDKCPYRSTHFMSVRIHASSHKRKPGKSSFKCEYCDYYGCSKSMILHEQLHEGRVPKSNKRKQTPVTMTTSLSERKQLPVNKESSLFEGKQTPVTMTTSLSERKQLPVKEETSLFDVKQVPVTMATSLYESNQEQVTEDTNLSERKQVPITKETNLSKRKISLKTARKVNGKLFCKICPYSTSKKSRFVQHEHWNIQKPGPSTYFQCDACPFKTINRVKIKRHKKGHEQQPDAIYKCKYCDFWSSVRTGRGRHEKIHPETWNLPKSTYKKVHKKSGNTNIHKTNEKSVPTQSIGDSSSVKVTDRSLWDTNFMRGNHDLGNLENRSKKEDDALKVERENCNVMETDKDEDNMIVVERESYYGDNDLFEDYNNDTEDDMEFNDSTSSVHGIDYAGILFNECKYCGQDFPSIQLLKDHERRHWLGNENQYRYEVDGWTKIMCVHCRILPYQECTEKS
ncbi:hypothetical protein ACF0H5_011475 [Mactra antiquata]